MSNLAPYFWQNQQWSVLAELALKQQLSHALLLKGIVGLGKNDFARAFAKFILCTNKIALSACLQCKSCRLFGKQSHPDFMCITPEEEGKAIKVDAIKDLVSKMAETSQYYGYKVCIIHPAEAMNVSAANALLKTLEEPTSGKTLFLLVSNEAMILPATIRSRCQQIYFNFPAVEKIKTWISHKNIDFNSDEFTLAAELAQNAPLKIQEYLQKNNLMRSLFHDLNQFLMSAEALTTAEFIKKYQSINLKDFINILQLALIQNFKEDVISNKKTEYYFAIFDSLNHHKSIAMKNVALNLQLLMENYLIKLEGLRNRVINNAH